MNAKIEFKADEGSYEVWTEGQKKGVVYKVRRYGTDRWAIRGRDSRGFGGTFRTRLDAAKEIVSTVV